MALKIAHLTDNISNNGVSRILLTLTNTSVSQGNETTVLTFRPALNQRLTDQFQCNVVPLKLANKNSNKHRFWKSKWDVLATAEQDSAVVDQWMEENAYDFVFIHGRPILRFHKIQAPHAAVVHSNQSKMYVPRMWDPRRALIQSYVRKIFITQPVVSVSDGIRKDLIDSFRIPDNTIKTIYNPVDIENIRQLSSENLSDLPQKPYFIAAGSAVKAKRYDILIRAFARCNTDANLVILGEGKLLSQYQTLALQLGVSERVHLLGYRDNPYPYFKHAIALVVSSDHEGFGLGIVEALACGTPVVSTDCPYGPSEILQGSLAEYLVPVRDVKALANAMERVAIKPYRYPGHLLNRFSASTIAYAYQKFSEELLLDCQL